MRCCSAFVPGYDQEGLPILSVLAKITFDIAQGGVSLSEQQIPLVNSDVYADPAAPQFSEVHAESDLVACKLFTDCVVTGSVYPPRGKKAYQLDCSVKVGPLSKNVRVFGNRTMEWRPFRGVVISEPQPFESIELGYRNAYGGITRTGKGTPVVFSPNSIGRGFVLRECIRKAGTVALPNLEDPENLLTGDNAVVAAPGKWSKAPRPSSLGWTRRDFYPRYTYAGILSEDTKVSNDESPRMDMRFYQGASEGLWGKLLSGNETVQLRYLDPVYSDFEFQLPAASPALVINIGEGSQQLTPFLQTVVINKNENKMTMIWRGSIKYGGLDTLGNCKLACSAEIESVTEPYLC
ncbi:MAG: DUF2169 family type VI secretion system accessory protein [Fibrobacterota bacterium]